MSAPGDVARSVARGVSRLMVGNLTDGQREQQLDALANCYAEQTDIRHPFAPLGDTPRRTRADLRRHFAAAPRLAGVQRYRSKRSASMILPIFSMAMPSTVSSETPGVMAPLLR